MSVLFSLERIHVYDYMHVEQVSVCLKQKLLDQRPKGREVHLIINSLSIFYLCCSHRSMQMCG